MGSTLARAIFASLLCHAALIAAASRETSERLTIEVEFPLALAAVEIEIVELPDAEDDATTTGGALGTSAEPHAETTTAARSTVAETGSNVSEPSSVETPSTEAPADGTKQLAMRGRSRPRWRAEIDPSFGTPTPPVKTQRDPLALPTPPGTRSSELTRRAGGHYETDLGTAVARTRPDGTVAITDRPNVSIKLKLPDKRLVGALLESWKADPYKHATGQSDIELPTDSIIGGGFDATDAIMRHIGDDPYLIKKLNFMDRTRDERAGIALKTTQDALADVARSVRRSLAWTAARDDLSDDDKRAIYFELWDECAETGSKGVLDASAAARATIVGFIRKNLPAGSRRGYTTDELDRLNKRRTSKARFDPYAKAL